MTIVPMMQKIWSLASTNISGTGSLRFLSSKELERWLTVLPPPPAPSFSQMRNGSLEGLWDLPQVEDPVTAEGVVTHRPPDAYSRVLSTLLPSFCQVLRENLQSVCSNLKEITPAIKVTWYHQESGTWRFSWRGGRTFVYPPRLCSWVDEINRH